MQEWVGELAQAIRPAAPVPQEGTAPTEAGVKFLDAVALRSVVAYRPPVIVPFIV